MSYRLEINVNGGDYCPKIAIKERENHILSLITKGRHRWIREKIDGWVSTWMEEWMGESRLESIGKIYTFSCIIEFSKYKRLELTGISHRRCQEG